jgi:hypothetical protein
MSNLIFIDTDETKKEYDIVMNTFFKNDDVSLTYIIEKKTFGCMNTNEINKFMKFTRTSYKKGNAIININNNISKTINNKKWFLLVLQNSKNGIYDETKNVLDPIGLIFDIGYLINGTIFIFISESIRDKVYNYIITGKN